MAETGVPIENYRPVTTHWQTLSHNVVSNAPLTMLVVICIDCICSCKSNYHTNMTVSSNVRNSKMYLRHHLRLLSWVLISNNFRGDEIKRIRGVQYIIINTTSFAMAFSYCNCDICHLQSSHIAKECLFQQQFGIYYYLCLDLLAIGAIMN